MSNVFIEAPVCQGSPTVGSQFAFEALLEGGKLDTAEYIRYSDISGEKYLWEGNDVLRFYNKVMPVSEFVCKSVKSVIESGKAPITVGGDHSVAIGSLAGVNAAIGKENYSVIYIDGHTDINSEKTTESGFIHGMPLAAALGICSDSLTVGNKINLLGKNTYIFGARSIDKGEYDNAEKCGVHLYTEDDVKSVGVSECIKNILSDIKTEHIHISFDVDFMNGDVFPATGYRMKNGFAFEDALTVLKAIKADGRICSGDFVEYNPKTDKDGKCLEMFYELIKTVI